MKLNLHKSNRLAQNSFYGSCHMREFPTSLYWLDPDDENRIEIPNWWDWKVEIDPRKIGDGYQPTNPQDSEDWWTENYSYPFDIIPAKGMPIFPIRSISPNSGKDDLKVPLAAESIRRGFFNSFFAEFYVDRYLTYSDLPEVWIGDKKAIASAQAKGRSKLAEIEKKLKQAKKNNVNGIVNIGLLGFMRDWPDFARAFFDKNPDADPKFLGFADEMAVSTTICPEHRLYLKLAESQIRELLIECPTLKYLMLTIDDDWAHVRCFNPEHNHPKYDLCNDVQIAKTLELIDTVYKTAQSIRPVVILCYCWNATFFTTDAKQMAKYGGQLPKANFVIIGKHNAPPSVDNAPNSDELNPGVELWNEAGFGLHWGEDGGHMNNFSLLSLYCNPEKIYEDMKILAQTGRTKLVHTYAESMFAHEIDSLALHASCWNPDFDLEKLKTDWARLRFGKAWEQMLDALALTPGILWKTTFYHEGFLQRNSLHLAMWGGVRSGEGVFLVPTPRWLADVDEKNYDELVNKIDPTPEARAVLEKCEQAKKNEPDNQVLDLYLSQAELTLNLAKFYRDYHTSFLEYRLAEQNPAQAEAHLGKAIDLIAQAVKSVDEYDKDTTLRWFSMNRRRYFVYFCRHACQVIRQTLQNKLEE